jgi:hypothetical protein
LTAGNIAEAAAWVVGLPPYMNVNRIDHADLPDPRPIADQAVMKTVHC